MASISIPLVYSFEGKMRFIKHWKIIFGSIILVAIPFLIWDVIFTKSGVWGFNPTYLTGYYFLSLPIEEILFFICIPYACIFTHYAFIHFFPTIRLSNKVTTFLMVLLSCFIIYQITTQYPKLYSTVNYTLLLFLLLYSFIGRHGILNRFFITFLIILIPFFIVNGILTGSWISEEVVWYNADEFSNIRIGTIPMEDIFYAFNLLYATVLVIESLRPNLMQKRRS